MNYRNNKKSKIIVIVLLAVVLTATIGYAVLNTVLKNQITATIAPVKWQVYMEKSLIYKDTTANSETNLVALANTADSCIEYDETDNTICTKSVTLEANVKFDKVEKYVIIKFYATNAGDMPAIIAENGIEVEGLGEFVTYSLKYSDSDNGLDVKPGDYFAPGASKPMYLKLKYFVSDNVTDEDLPTEDTTFNITIKIKFIRGSKDDFVNNSSSNAVITKSPIGSSDEIKSYTVAMGETDDSKLYLLESTADDQYPIYFWRGTRAKTKNNFIFADMCWLGIRTTDSGGIKIMYNGVPVDGKCTATTGPDTMIGSGVYNNNTYSSHYKNGSKNSNAKMASDTWYEEHLLSYQEYLEDTVFCNDLGSFYSSRKDGTPSLVCDAAQSFTVSTDYGNGELQYPIGLISADEAMLNGIGTKNSTYAFLYNGQQYWTMTQGTSSGYVYFINSTGELNYGGSGGYGWTVGDHSLGYRPVVSLNAGVSMTGTGSQDDPFVVTMK